MGKLRRTCLGRKPGVRKGVGLGVMKRVVAQDKKKEEGLKRDEEEAKIEDLSPLLTPKTQ